MAFFACALGAAEPGDAGAPAIAGRVSVDISPAYGFSGLHSVGCLVGLGYGLPLWADTASSAQVDLGILAGYQFEPFSQGDAMMSGAVTTGGLTAGGLVDLGIRLDDHVAILSRRLSPRCG